MNSRHRRPNVHAKGRPRQRSAHTNVGVIPNNRSSQAQIKKDTADTEDVYRMIDESVSATYNKMVEARGRFRNHTDASVMALRCGRATSILPHDFARFQIRNPLGISGKPRRLVRRKPPIQPPTLSLL